VFVAPSKIRKSSFEVALFFREIRELPIIAACPEPTPGRKTTNWGKQLENLKMRLQLDVDLLLKDL